MLIIVVLSNSTINFQEKINDNFNLLLPEGKSVSYLEELLNC